jgi:hypothetical protein
MTTLQPVGYICASSPHVRTVTLSTRVLDQHQRERSLCDRLLISPRLCEKANNPPRQPRSGPSYDGPQVRVPVAKLASTTAPPPPTCLVQPLTALTAIITQPGGLP